jgi:hypothetical protein
LGAALIGLVFGIQNTSNQNRCCRCEEDPRGSRGKGVFGLYPLQQAEAGAARISYDVKIFVAGPMLVAFGLMLLVGGARIGRAFSGPPRTREQHLLIWPTFAVALAAGGVAFWWFTERLHALATPPRHDVLA